MKSQNANVDAATINYQFTAIPTNLFYLLDNNTRTLLFCLIQSSTYFAKKDGFFYITKDAIGELTNLSLNVITAAIDTLYINGLIYVQTVGKSKGKYVNHYRVNFEQFTKFEDMTFEDLKNPLNKIEMVKYKSHYQPQYIKDYLNGDCKDVCKEQCKQQCKEQCKKVITNIDNINNIENIDNKENINNKNNIYNNIDQYINKEYNTSNILGESEEIGLSPNPISEMKEELNNNLKNKEVEVLETSTSNEKEETNHHTPMKVVIDDVDTVLDMMFAETPTHTNKKENITNIRDVEVLKPSTSNKKENKIEENNNTFQLGEVGMLEEKNKTIPSMTDKFRRNYEDCLARLGNGVGSVAQLKEKVTKLCDWVERCSASYSVEDKETINQQINAKYKEVKGILETNIAEFNKVIENFAKGGEMELDPHNAKTKAQNKREQEQAEKETASSVTKEQLEKTLNDITDTLSKYGDIEMALYSINYVAKNYDREIREYKLMEEVQDVFKAIKAQETANEAILTTFNSQDKESINSNEKTQENALKSICVDVDDTEEYPF